MKGDIDKKYKIKETVYYSDGTETSFEYHQNPNATEIEAKVAEAVIPAIEEVVEVETPVEVVEEEVVEEAEVKEEE